MADPIRARVLQARATSAAHLTNILFFFSKSNTRAPESIKHYPLADMKRVIVQEEAPVKVVGSRRPPADSLAPAPAQTIENACAWKQKLGALPIPKGLYRFRTHEEADEWLWQMLTRPHH